MQEITIKPEEIIAPGINEFKSPDAVYYMWREYVIGNPVIIPKAVVMHQAVTRIYMHHIPELEEFLEKNPDAKYFLLDGTHRGIAATLVNRDISAYRIMNTDDLGMVEYHRMNGNLPPGTEIQGNSLQEICLNIKRHFEQETRILTLRELTADLVAKRMVPEYMRSHYRRAI